MRRPYPITAFSLTCGLGETSSKCFESLEAGRRGLREVPFAVPFSTVTGTVPVALPELDAAHRHMSSRTARLAAFGYREFRPAVENAIARLGAHRIGIVMGTSTGGIDRTEDAYAAWREDERFGADYAYATQHPFHGFTDLLSSLSGVTGPRWVVSTACSSSAKVFATARRMLDLDLCDAVWVGGVDALCNTTVRGFHSLGVMASEPCRPFGKDRPGMNVGEAAAYVLLEKSTKTTPHAWLLGVGETSDAYHMSSPDPEGSGAIAAMKQALADGGVSPHEVDYINAHGTGTQYNDASESAAVLKLIGKDVPVVSTKGYTGHTLGACGGVEAVLAIHALENGFIPGSPWSAPLDVDVNVPAESQRRDVRHVLSNSFAFGGNNCSVLLSRSDTR